MMRNDEERVEWEGFALGLSYIGDLDPKRLGLVIIKTAQR